MANFRSIEGPLVSAVAAMERDGIQVDPVALAELSRDFARRIADLDRRSSAPSATTSTAAFR
jgi:DNA polymerase I-like protein with 3'-5' exonuclease and polymerase domains